MLMISILYLIFTIESVGSHILEIFFEQFDFDMLDESHRRSGKMSRL